MSIQAIAWVLDHSQSRGLTRLVLISLANHANHDGECWPSQRTIGREAGIGKSTVAPAIGRLVEIGELEIVEPGDKHRSARYRLLIGVRQPDSVPAPGPDSVPAPGAGRIVMNRHEPGSVRSPRAQGQGGRFRGELQPIRDRLEQPNCADCGGTGWQEQEPGVVVRCEHGKPE